MYELMEIRLECCSLSLKMNHPREQLYIPLMFDSWLTPSKQIQNAASNSYTMPTQGVYEIHEVIF